MYSEVTPYIKNVIVKYIMTTGRSHVGFMYSNTFTHDIINFNSNNSATVEVRC